MFGVITTTLSKPDISYQLSKPYVITDIIYVHYQFECLLSQILVLRVR